MSKCSVHGKIELTANLVATVCVPAELGHVFAVGSLGCAQKSFGEVAKFLFWARTKLHKQVLQEMATPVYYATHCRSRSIHWQVRIASTCDAYKYCLCNLPSLPDDFSLTTAICFLSCQNQL